MKRHLETGHFSEPSVEKHLDFLIKFIIGRYVGCAGQSMPEVFGEVKDFMAESNDFVILKFGHYLDIGEERDFLPDQLEALTELVKDELSGDLYVDNDLPENDVLKTLEVRKLLSGGGKILAVFEDLPSELRGNGIFSYSDINENGTKTGSADLFVYDNYSETAAYASMKEDQIKKLEKYGNTMFLLSWTLTPDSLDDSVLGLAKNANSHLAVEMFWDPPRVTLKTIPNILYVDDAGEYAAAIALSLNKKLHDAP